MTNNKNKINNYTYNYDNNPKLKINTNFHKDYSKDNTTNPKSSKTKKTFVKLPKKPAVASIIIFLILIWLFTGDHVKNSHDAEYEDNLTQNLILPPTSIQETSNTTNKLNKPKNDSSRIITTEITIKPNDNIGKILNNFNISNEDAIAILNDKKIIDKLKKIQAHQKITLNYQQTINNTNNNLISLNYFLDKATMLIIEKNNDSNTLAQNRFVTKIEKLKLVDKISFAKLEITSSLFEDAHRKNIPIDLIFQISDIFAWDIDFAQDLRSSDTVEMMYEEYYFNGSPHSIGPIIAVNFYNNGKKYSAIRFGNSNKAEYYTPEGLALRKAFIRTPVKFTRISSKFNLKRNHPILHRIRAHKGVDYAAPVGTPIKAAGNGKIIYYGRKGGYGKAAIIQHGSKYTTLYGHMSNYNSKLKVGSVVQQGEVIGYVGQTGLAAGPHLHFEFRVNDENVNPLTVALPRASSIPEQNRDSFLKISSKIFASLKLYSNNYIAKNKFE